MPFFLFIFFLIITGAWFLWKAFLAALIILPFYGIYHYFLSQKGYTQEQTMKQFQGLCIILFILGMFIYFIVCSIQQSNEYELTTKYGGFCTNVNVYHSYETQEYKDCLHRMDEYDKQK
jgi:hypothetical protein